MEDDHISRHRAYYDQNLKNNLGRDNDSVKNLLPGFYRGFTGGGKTMKSYLNNLEIRFLFSSRRRLDSTLFSERLSSRSKLDFKNIKSLRSYNGPYVSITRSSFKHRPIGRRSFLHMQKSFYLLDSRKHFYNGGLTIKRAHDIVQGTRIFRSFLKKRRYLNREYGADSFEVRRHEFLFESAFGAQRNVLDATYFSTEDFEEFFDMVSPGYYYILGATYSRKPLPLDIRGDLSWGGQQGISKVFFLGQKNYYILKHSFTWKYRRASILTMPITKYAPFRFRIYRKYRKAKVERGRPYFRFLFSFFAGNHPFRLKRHFGLHLKFQKYFRRLYRIKSKKKLVQSFLTINKGWELLHKKFESQLAFLLSSQFFFKNKGFSRRAIHNGRIYVNGGKVLAESYRVRKYDLILQTRGSFNEGLCSPRVLKGFFRHLYFNYRDPLGVSRSMFGGPSLVGGSKLQVYLGPSKVDIGLRKKLRHRVRAGRWPLSNDFSVFQLFGNILF